MFYSMRNKVLYIALFFLVISGGRFIYCWKQEGSRLLPDMVVASSIVVAIILIDIYRLKPAPSHTFKSLILQYIYLRATMVCGYILKTRFDKVCKKCEEQQENILKEILAQNKDTLFARDHGLENVNSVKTFRETMPLTSYGNYRKYAEMVKEEGTENILFPGKAYYLALTSGTTSGKSKVFPKNPKKRNKAMTWLITLQYILTYATENNFLTKWLYVKLLPTLIATKSGIESGPVSAVTNKINVPFFAVPNLSIHTEYEALYIHLAFSLAEDDVSCFSTMVSTTALSLLTILEKDWSLLCNDIENGRLSESLDIPAVERNRLNNLMKADPRRGAFLRKEFAKGFKSVVSRIWPQCPCLLAIKTGVFETPANIVREKYLGDLPIVTLLHVGTETMYGMNIDPMAQPDVNYVALLPINFFEFLPVEEFEEKSPSTLLAHQVEVGQMYEMVITTFDGLYRYRTEDVVKITGFCGTTPVYQFMYRAGDILTANMEKVPEFLLHDAVYAAAATWKESIEDFTSCESVHVHLAGAPDTSSRYVVFIELRDAKTLDEHEVNMVDKELCERHTVYAAMRKNNKLQPVQMIQMKTGAFDKIKEMMLASNPDAFCMQYKLPRIMRRKDILKAMLDMKI
ncbi:uncharacterized protein LOC123548898 [Mercenaria mercenaria]|uniref:uncharacterized protein LOC123548898 n=1 Tax=Mercenaria mercenaria TaxID=6596 RepID=UPI00234E4F49|nr:uncharacterized protein LOC123548898 [Mercenaria mercenaria]